MLARVSRKFIAVCGIVIATVPLALVLPCALRGTTPSTRPISPRQTAPAVVSPPPENTAAADERVSHGALPGSPPSLVPSAESHGTPSEKENSIHRPPIVSAHKVEISTSPYVPSDARELEIMRLLAIFLDGNSASYSDGRCILVDELAHYSSDHAMTALRTLVTHDADPFVRARALRGLVGIDASEQAALLLFHVMRTDASPVVRRCAITSMPRLLSKTNGTVASFRDVMLETIGSDPDTEVAAWAAYSLADIVEVQEFRYLAESLLQTETREQVRQKLLSRLQPKAARQSPK